MGDTMKKLFCTMALVGMLVAPAAIQAQLSGGPVVAYHDDGEAFGVGAYVAIPLTQLAEGFAINPNFIYFFPDVGSVWEINGDLVYRFPVSGDSPIAPFALGGINIQRFSADIGTVSVSNTDTGINLGGGVVFPMESIRPFVGGKFELQSETSLVIFGGIGFSFGG